MRAIHVAVATADASAANINGNVLYDGDCSRVALQLLYDSDRCDTVLACSSEYHMMEIVHDIVCDNVLQHFLLAAMCRTRRRLLRYSRICS